MSAPTLHGNPAVVTGAGDGISLGTAREPGRVWRIGGPEDAARLRDLAPAHVAFAARAH